MRISQLTLTGRGNWADLHIDHLNQRLNVLHGPPRSGKSTLAQLLGQLLDGTEENHEANEPATLDAEGSMLVETRRGHFLLRRYYDGNRQIRRTVSALDHSSSLRPAQRLRHDELASLHDELPPRWLSQFLSADFSKPPRIDWLLGQLHHRGDGRRVRTGRHPQSLKQMGQLLDELDGQIAQIARANQPVDRTLHERTTRLTTLAEGLRQQVDAARGLFAEQSRPRRRRPSWWPTDALTDDTPARLRQSPEPEGGPWRASDILARLTDGQLVQIRLQADGAEDHPIQNLVVLTRENRRLAFDALTEAQHDQLHLALILALAATYSAEGIRLPLVLDEPFLRQDEAGTAAMAGQLRRFAQLGLQLFVLTGDAHAVRCFESAGVKTIDLEQLRRPLDMPEPEAQPQEASTIRLARTNESAKPQTAVRHGTDTFHLGESTSLEHFPVLGSDTAERFARLGLHSVGDLLAADSSHVAEQLHQPEVTPGVVTMWQSHLGLICFVPEVSFADAQVLSAVGIFAPDDLPKTDADEFYAAVERLLASDRGQRLAQAKNRFRRGRLSTLRSGAQRHHQRWQEAQKRYTWLQGKAGAA